MWYKRFFETRQARKQLGGANRLPRPAVLLRARLRLEALERRQRHISWAQKHATKAGGRLGFRPPTVPMRKEVLR